MKTPYPEFERFKELYAKGVRQILTDDEYLELDELELWLVERIARGGP